MKAVILCGGIGTRIRDISETLPKPMLPIGDKPILWHIMKSYSHYGIKDFVLCLGYKGWTIKEFFLNYHAKISDVSVNLSKSNSIQFYAPADEDDWNITLAETGEKAQTGARVFNVKKYLEGGKYFCLTYGDGVSDVNMKDLLGAHKNSGLICTVTGVRPEGRFGELVIEGEKVVEFSEKTNVRSGYINGGFMVFDSSRIWKYFRPGDDLILERDVLSRLAGDGQLGVFRHDGFWYCCDTPREYAILNNLWEEKKVPWKVWK